MKIKSVVVVTEDDVRKEIPWDDFIYLLGRDSHDSGYWPEDKCNELRERLGTETPHEDVDKLN